MRTCELSGYGSSADADPDLIEWNYGDYEGKTRPQILAERPGWVIFRDGCPNGESTTDVGIRANRVMYRVRKVDGNVLIFSSSHLSPDGTMAALGPSGGRYFKLGRPRSGVGYDHSNRAVPNC
jgi:probable phosphoglycerate mutase